jgi:hypothetical protein
MARMIPRLVYRPVLSRVCAVAVVAFCAWWALALLLDRRWPELGTALPGLVTAGALAYAVLWRPEVVVDDGGVLLRNVARDVRVPWAALRDVQTRYALTLLTDRSRYTSWAATAPGRPSVLKSRRDAVSPSRDRLADSRWLPDRPHHQSASRDLEADSGAAAFMVEQGWSAWRVAGTADEAAAESVSWAWGCLVVLVPAVLLAAGVALL